MDLLLMRFPAGWRSDLSGDWNTHELPDRPAAADRAGLLAFLLSHRDGAVRASGARLRRQDTLTLQIVLAASRDWRDRGLAFEYLLPARFAAGMERLGISPAMLDWRAA